MKPSEDLGQELRRLRQEEGLTLRRLADAVGVSAAHLSDLEHNRRRPSDALLRKIARTLRRTGANYERLEQLSTGMDPDLREWVATTPGVRRLLRAVKESGMDPLEILPKFERILARKRAAG
jgi:transcriptional regulator with XRE-family HTH domain